MQCLHWSTAHSCELQTQNPCRQLRLVEIQKDVFICNGNRAWPGEAEEEIPEHNDRSALLADLIHLRTHTFLLARGDAVG
jgi:hypothetical protein